VGALVIPEATHSLTINQFNHHRHRWAGLGGEIKGSALNERQVAAVVELLLRHRAVFFVTGTIMSGLSPAIVADGKKVQGERLTASLTENHQPTVVQQLLELRSRVETMSAPEFVQFTLLRKLVENVLRVSLNHFGFNGPRELGRFLWKADAKNNGRSSYEICWGKLGAGLLQSAFLARPLETDRTATTATSTTHTCSRRRNGQITFPDLSAAVRGARWIWVRFFVSLFLSLTHATRRASSSRILSLMLFAEQ